MAVAPTGTRFPSTSAGSGKTSSLSCVRMISIFFNVPPPFSDVLTKRSSPRAHFTYILTVDR